MAVTAPMKPVSIHGQSPSLKRLELIKTKANSTLQTILCAVAELYSHTKKCLAFPKHLHFIVIAFVLTTKDLAAPEHGVMNDSNIHVLSAKLNLAYLLQVITGAFVYTERNQINN
jgi:hypothetical protein